MQKKKLETTIQPQYNYKFTIDWYDTSISISKHSKWRHELYDRYYDIESGRDDTKIIVNNIKKTIYKIWTIIDVLCWCVYLA